MKRKNMWMMMAVAVGGLMAFGTPLAMAQMPEACCFPDGSCMDMPPQDCQAQGGIPQGAGTMCLGDMDGNGTDDACEGASEPGACCAPDGSCYGELEDLCILQGGVFQGPGTVCLGDLNGNGVDDACEDLPIKFIQEPDINQTGIDVKATSPNILADDFLCEQRSLITDITVWGSWKNDFLPGDLPDAGSVTFTLSIHEDIPAAQSPTGYSMPGDVLWYRTFQPGAFTTSLYLGNLEEYWWDPFGSWIFPGDTECWQYDFQIPVEDAFCQQGNPDAPVVYWLDVQAVPVGDQAEFGWKTVISPESNFNDAAVAGQGSEPYTGSWTKLVYPMDGHVWQGEDIGLAFSIGGDEPCPGEEPREYGDAPEGALAYPANGVTGQFPTCLFVGPAGYIQHNNFGAYFGPSFDFELDGNAGLCPLFNPNSYDADECWQDGDAGLITPPSYTIQGPVGGEQVVPCTGQVGALGRTCQTAVWGTNIDVNVTNNMPSQSIGYVNVLIDWNQDGAWGGASQCPTAQAPEHVLVDFQVPNGFSGALSALGPPSFLIGPNPDYVWARVTITEVTVGAGWDGTGTFEDGETEDYLLLVDPAEEYDFGDAPDPTYPTLLANNGARHVIVQGILLGNQIDAEPNGQPTANADGDDLNNLPDEDGVAFTTLLVPGQPAQVNVTASVPGYLWAWIDFDGNGSWAEAADQIANGLALNAGVNTVAFTVPAAALPGPTYARFRFTTDGTVNLSYTGAASDGEVEDYRVMIEEEIPEDSDFGDAPEDALAYPATGVTGWFPTCMNVGPPGSYIQHGLGWAFFGPSWDPEPDGNGGLCPSFAPYDNDECFQDGDAGLIVPQPFTIVGGVEVPCPGSTGTPLGNPCLPATWGIDIDINVTNNMSVDGYVNVLIDWDQGGTWGGASPCPMAAAPEHVLVDFLVPAGFSGPLSALAPPGFLIGPNTGYVWARFTITDVPVMGSGIEWDGSGVFEDGETEDYLTLVVPTPPVVTAAVSRKTHNTTAYDIDACAGDTEPRTGGPTKVIVTFDQPIQQVTGTVADVSVSSGTVTTLTVVGSTLTIDMNGATNAQPLIITFPGIRSALPYGQISQGGVCIRVLAGDVNNDGTVNIFDLVTVRDNSGKLVTSSNFRSDVNADGSINIFDLVVVRDNSGNSVALCPGPGCW